MTQNRPYMYEFIDISKSLKALHSTIHMCMWLLSTNFWKQTWNLEWETVDICNNILYHCGCPIKQYIEYISMNKIALLAQSKLFYPVIDIWTMDIRHHRDCQFFLYFFFSKNNFLRSQQVHISLRDSTYDKKVRKTAISAKSDWNVWIIWMETSISSEESVEQWKYSPQNCM